MITNATLSRIFWLLLFVKASSLVTDEALLIASCVDSLVCSLSGEGGVSFHAYVFDKERQLNKYSGDVGQDNIYIHTYIYMYYGAKV